MSVKIERPTKEELQQQYDIPGVSISELSRRYKTSNPTVRKWLIYYGITRKFQKHKLEKMLDTFNPNLTEFENMKMNGYDRIWDCGNVKFVWNKEMGGV